MRTVAAEALLLALYYVGAALIASALLDWIAVEHLRMELMDHPWCAPARELVFGGIGRGTSGRALLALMGVGTIFGAAAFALVRIRRFALPLLVASAGTVVVSLLFPIFEAVRNSWSLLALRDPATGEFWLQSHTLMRGELAESAAFTLPVLSIALGAAAARYAARWGTPTARAWSTAAALVVPFVGACVLAAIFLGTWRLRGQAHAHWSWLEVHDLGRWVMVAGGVAIALAATPGILRDRSSSSPRLLPALLLVVVGTAAHAWAAPLRRIDGDSPAPRHDSMEIQGRSLLSTPWDFPRARAPCLDRSPVMRTWVVRVDDRGRLRLRWRHFQETEDMGEPWDVAEAAKALLLDVRGKDRDHGVVLLVDARARVSALTPLLELLSGPEVAQVRVAGLVVERVPWVDAEILTWNACAFGLLRTEAIAAGRFDSEQTWGSPSKKLSPAAPRGSGSAFMPKRSCQLMTCPPEHLAHRGRRGRRGRRGHRGHRGPRRRRAGGPCTRRGCSRAAP